MTDGEQGEQFDDQAHKLGVMDNRRFGRQYFLVQSAFLRFMVKQFKKTFPGKTCNEYEELILPQTQDPYRDWYEGLLQVETVENFFGCYVGPGGAMRLFKELFPGERVEDFFRKCLNGKAEATLLVDQNVLSVHTTFVHTAVENLLS